jgi:hypothetical protein
VDRAGAPTVEVADELDLGAEEVRAAPRDERHRLVEPPLVPLSGLVPRDAIGGLHGQDVGRLGRGGRADVRRGSLSIGAPAGQYGQR